MINITPEIIKEMKEEIEKYGWNFISNKYHPRNNKAPNAADRYKIYKMIFENMDLKHHPITKKNTSKSTRKTTNSKNHSTKTSNKKASSKVSSKKAKVKTPKYPNIIFKYLLYFFLTICSIYIIYYTFTNGN